MFPIRIGLLLFLAISHLPAQDGSALRIASGSPLPPAILSENYVQTLFATGGTPPYTWAVASGILPPGLTFSSNGSFAGIPAVLGSSTLTIQVTDSAGNRATQLFSLGVISQASISRFGVVSHIAAGGTWSTAITLVNSSAQAVPMKVNFYADDGSPLTLPLVVAQQGSTQTVTTAGLDAALNPNTTLVVNTGALQSTVVGWAEVLTPGPLSGHAIFRTTPPSGPASEGTVALQTQTPSTFVLPYDNTGAFVMGVAFANASTGSTDITATIWDDNGIQLGIQTITLAGKGHSAFVMSTQLPLTAGRRGIVRFQSSGTGGLAGIGLRFSPLNTFTSVPLQ